METTNNRNKWLHVRLTEQEHMQITKAFSKTTLRKLSDYARSILLGKPMIGSYRNKSMDDFMAEMILLRTELNSIGNNFNQVVKKLHSTPNSEAISRLLIGYELDKRLLLKHIENIQLFIDKNDDKW